MSDTADWTGRKIGKYRITRLIGRGGAGCVYEGKDNHLKRPVAIKLLPADPETMPRFLREARTAARISHPNVVSVYDVGKSGSAFYIVMELVRGESAHDLVKRRGPLPPAEANRIVMAVCKGLHAAHAAGLVHRDIKPANILCPADGEPQLADFGLAKAALEEGGQLTHANTLIGTPHYMSPEQCRCEPLDERSDIYSLGAAWYYLLTGRPPFDGGDRLGVLFAHCSDPVPDPRSANPAIDEACVAALHKALAKNRGDRFADCKDFQDAIAALEKARSTPNDPPTILPRVPSARASHRIRWLLPAVAALTVGVFFIARPQGGSAVLPEKGREKSVGRDNRNKQPAVKPAVETKAPALKEHPFEPMKETPTGMMPFWHLRDMNAGAKFVRFLPESTRFATSDGKGTITVWFPPMNRFHKATLPESSIRAVAGGPRGQWLAAAGLGNLVYLFAPPDWKRVGSVAVEKGPVNALAAHRQWLAVGSPGGLSLHYTSAFPATRPIALPPPSREPVTQMFVSPDGVRLASIAGDRRLDMWDPTGRRYLARTDLPDYSVLGLTFGPDANTLACFGRKEGRTLWHRWNPTGGAGMEPIAGPDQALFAAALPGGATVAFLTADRIGLFEPFSGNLNIRFLEATLQASKPVAFDAAPDGRGVAIGYEDGSVQLWTFTRGGEGRGSGPEHP